MTNKINFLFMLLSIATILNAQTRTYTGTASVYTAVSPTSGTETYSYIVNDDGDKLINGTYSFSSAKKTKDSESTIEYNYVIKANGLKGLLNGAYSQKFNWSSQIWEPRVLEWKTASSNVSLTGNFKNGEPDGTFTFKDESHVYFTNANYNHSGTATFKNGKYIGKYQFNGWDEDGFHIELSGQLTDDGRLTGSWLYKRKKFQANMTFINNVMIDITTSESSKATPPTIIELSKKYANHQITKEQLLEQGIYILEDEIPLQSILTGAIFGNLGNETNHFGFSTIPAKVSLEKYGPVTYQFLMQIPLFTKEGFNIWLNLVRKYGLKENPDAYGGLFPLNYCEGELKSDKLCGNGNNFCQLDPLTIVKTYNLHRIFCGFPFAKLYSTRKDNYDYIYLTPDQYTQFCAVADSLLEANALPLQDFLITIEDKYRGFYEENLFRTISFEDSTLMEETLTNNITKNVVSSTLEDFFKIRFDSIKPYSRDYLEHKRATSFGREKELSIFQDSILVAGAYTSYHIDSVIINNLYAAYIHAKQRLNLFNQYQNAISQLGNEILKTTEEMGYSKIYSAYINNLGYYSIKWSGYNSLERISEVIISQQKYVEAINNYYEILTNDTILTASLSSNKSVFAAYEENKKAIDSWQGIQDNEILIQFLNAQELYAKIGETFKQISNNSNTIKSLYSKNKRILDTYAQYESNILSSWVSLNDNEKIETLLPIQQVLIDATTKPNFKKLVSLCQKSKDNKIETIIDILEQ